METEYLELESDPWEQEDDPSSMCVEADTEDRSVQFTVKSSAPCMDLPVSELKKLRDFLNDFLNECD